ncbi:hypothetical protein ACF0H5_004663 [Mactra antiquata]
MAKQSKCSSKRRHLRQYITDMVLNIEKVMLNIHTVLGEVNVLVEQIDNIAERMETRCGERQIKTTLTKSNVILDANQNACDVIETPALSNTSKLTFPSPYMDYTYLELTNECNTCNDNMNGYRFRYNEKYPLWIQCDTWKTDHSASEISEVSSGSDSNSYYYENNNDTYDKSWNTTSDAGRNSNSYDRGKRKSRKYQNDEFDIVNFSKCCNNSHNDVNENYCGVYEQIMELQLEDLDSLAPDFIKSSERNGSFSSVSDTSSDNGMMTNYVYSPDLPDSRYTSGHRHNDVTVRECSDSNPSLSE